MQKPEHLFYQYIKVAALQLYIARSILPQNIFMMYLNPHIAYNYIKKLKVAFTNRNPFAHA